MFDIILIGVTMFALLSYATPILPYWYLWEILFAAILAVSLRLAIKYPSTGKRWILLLFLVGVAEFEFSHNIPPYSNLRLGMIIGLLTAYSGIIIPVFYLAKLHLRKKQVKIFFLLSGCLELIAGSVGIFYRIYLGSAAGISFYLGYEGILYFALYFGLITIGSYSLIVGDASTFFDKPKQAKIFFVLSGFLELLVGLVGVFYLFYAGYEVDEFFYLGYQGGILYFVLLSIGFYSLIVGIASLFFPKPKKP